MRDPSDPPRQFYGLKPREFERVNPPPAPPSTPAAEMPAPVVDPAARIEVRALHAQAAVPGPLLQPKREPRPDSEIQGVLRENHAREAAAGLFELAPKPPRKSRRKRDYWLVMAAGNAFFIGAAVLGFLARNPIMFVSAIAGAGILSASVTWVMWFIVEDY